jgi:hypothetical protein
MNLKKQIYKKNQFIGPKEIVIPRLFFVNNNNDSNWLSKKGAIYKEEALSLDRNILGNRLKNILYFLD